MMNKLSQVNSSPWVTTAIAAGVAFVIGLLFGLVVLGWWVWPVKWVNASPADLRPDYRQTYLQMAVEAYALTGDQKVAKDRFEALGKYGPEMLETLAQTPPTGLSVMTIGDFAQAVGASVAGMPAATAKPTRVVGTPAAGGGQEAETGTAGLNGLLLTPTPAATPPAKHSIAFRLISVLCGISLLALIAAAGVFFWHSRQGPKTPATAAQRAQAMTQAAEATNFEAEGREPPISQFMTTYVHGDDLFDDSFSIDSPSGEFLGECGIGITDTIGVGEPKRVTAFEVWLFDKNDIQTVTKVLMSEHAYNDEEIRQRLAAKGDPVMAKPGEEIVLETAQLQLVARVVDMAYGDDALPANSYFERLTLELAVWPKEEKPTEGEPA